MLATIPSFSQQVLADLRAAGYRPTAWGRMLAASWRMARATAQAQPQFVREWRGSAALLALLTIGTTAAAVRQRGPRRALAEHWPLALTVALQAGDGYVHLGMHRRPDGTPHPTLGPAMPLTLVRGWVGGWATTRLLARRPLHDAEITVALALTLTTDLLDGPLARHTDHASALGRYLDGEADLLAWTALTLTQTRRGQIPSWFLLVFALRWSVPTMLSFWRSFAQANPVVLTPNWLGRAAGTGQVVLAIMGLIATRRITQPDATLWRRGRDLAALATAALLTATTIAHVRRLRQP